jgi:hypothetical protein
MIQIEFTQIFLLSIIFSGIALFIDECLQDGMVFGWWLPFLERLGVSQFWQKPVGGCVICTCFWLSFIGSLSLGLPLPTAFLVGAFAYIPLRLFKHLLD